MIAPTRVSPPQTAKVARKVLYFSDAPYEGGAERYIEYLVGCLPDSWAAVKPAGAPPNRSGTPVACTSESNSASAGRRRGIAREKFMSSCAFVSFETLLR